MVLVGVSILIVSLSYLCYRNLDSSLSFVAWVQRTLRRYGGESIAAPLHQDVKSDEKEVLEKMRKMDEDRKVMPPPPPPPILSVPVPVSSFTASAATTTSAKPSIIETLAESNVSALPSFQVNNNPKSPSLAVFPATNSIQRASGGRGPPRLNSLPVSQPPLRSLNGLSPPPSRSSLPNRLPTASSSSLALPPTHSAIPTKPRIKVQLTPGHSPLDWAHLSTRHDVNLRGLPDDTPYLRVPPSLLRQYTGRKGKDAWTVLGGKVYNITPYLPFHPGGVAELMKAAGRDGTKLFGEIHPWVNWEGMLEPCMIGVAVREEELNTRNILEDMD